MNEIVWPKKDNVNHDGNLDEKYQKELIQMLQEKANKYPYGFDIEIKNSLAEQVYIYMTEELGLYVEEVGSDSISKCFGIYENEFDLKNRESGR
jgi:hypothetical protein